MPSLAQRRSSQDKRLVEKRTFLEFTDNADAASPYDEVHPRFGRSRSLSESDLVGAAASEATSRTPMKATVSGDTLVKSSPGGSTCADSDTEESRKCSTSGISEPISTSVQTDDECGMPRTDDECDMPRYHPSSCMPPSCATAPSMPMFQLAAFPCFAGAVPVLAAVGQHEAAAAQLENVAMQLRLSALEAEQAAAEQRQHMAEQRWERYNRRSRNSTWPQDSQRSQPPSSSAPVETSRQSDDVQPYQQPERQQQAPQGSKLTRGERQARRRGASALVAAPDETEKAPAAEEDDRTTIMIRNIPNVINRAMLMEILNKEFFGDYNFLYLPMDFVRATNLGYAFVNMATHEAAQRFHRQFHGFASWGVESPKVAEVAWGGPIQGFQSHIDRYRNSPLMHPGVPDEFKPVVLSEGLPYTFPSASKKLRPPRFKHGSRVQMLMQFGMTPGSVDSSEAAIETMDAA